MEQATYYKSLIISLFIFYLFTVGVHPFLPGNLLCTRLLGLSGLKIFHLLFEIIVCHDYMSFKSSRTGKFFLETTRIAPESMVIRTERSIE